MASTNTSKLADSLNLTKTDLDGLYLNLGISPENRDDFSMTMSVDDWDMSDKIREAVRYLGFDAKQIIAQFYKKALENPKLEGDVMDLTCGEVRLYSKNEPKTDLLFFINVFLERGNNVSKAVTRCDGAAGAVLRRKATAYGISLEPTKNKTSLGTRDLTLARLAQAFSVCTSAVIIAKKVPGKLVSKLYGPLTNMIMQHTVFPGLIPSNTSYTDDLRDIAVVLNMEMSILLASPKDKRKIATKTVDELMETSEQFVDAAINGNTVTDSVKIKILVKAGVLKVSGSTTALTDNVNLMLQKSATIKSRGRLTYSGLVTHCFY